MMNLSAMAKYEAYKDSGVEWLGDIPEHWNVLRFRDLFKFGRGLTITKENLQEEGIPCISYGEVHSKYGFEFSPQKHILKCVSDDYLIKSSNSLLNEGDFIFADTSEDIEGSGNFSQLITDDVVFAGYHIVICRPQGLNNHRYLAYCIESNSYRDQVRVQVKGVKVYSITQSILKNTHIWLPKVEEQKLISNFLDQKTAQIDEAIAIKEQQIELLKEHRQIIIQQAVTQGLDPKVTMKDSGVEWVGQIPEHWEAVKLSNVAKIDAGSTPSRSNSNYWGGNIPWIKTGEVNYNTIFGSEECITTAGLKGSSLRLAPIGTLLMAMYGQGVTRGRVAILGIPATYNQACCGITFKSCVNVEFARFFFIAAYSYIREDGNETSQMNLSAGYISSIRIAVPNLDEQGIIIKYLDAFSLSVDEAVSLQVQQIQRLKEYKTTLINSAVTGKIKVTADMVHAHA